MIIPLIIEGVVVGLEGGLQLQQSYGWVESAAVHRMGQGTGFKQVHWRRRKTKIQGNGWVPSVLHSVDWDLPVDIHCVQPMPIHSMSNVIALPAVRRSDTPYGAWATVDNRVVPTSVSVAGDTATLGVIVGATGYMVSYFPIFTCYALGRPEEQFDAMIAEYSWSLDAEEI